MPVRVLIVDDSEICRGALRLALSVDPDLEVIGEAADGEEAIRRVAIAAPDVVLMDLNMPRLSGLDAIAWIMKYRPTPVLAISERSSIAGEEAETAALDRGAVELWPKSGWAVGSPEARELVAKVKSLAQGAARLPPVLGSVRPERSRPLGWKPTVLGLGASTGGPKALAELLSVLPAGFPVPIVVVQHMDAQFESSFVAWLARSSRLDVHLARDDERLEAGCALIGPQGKDLVVTEDCVRLVRPLEGARHVPSVDRLFRSLARHHGSTAMAALLSGMGDDGAAALRAIYDVGGLTVAQDERSSVVHGMPAAAIELGAAECVLPLKDIGPYLVGRVAGELPPPPERSPGRGSSAKVLVVDDSLVVLESARQALESAGFEVVTCDNPLSVPTLVRREQPQVVLIDVSMPAVSGDLVAQIVRQHGLAARTKVFLFSDRSAADLEERCRRCSADGYVEKSHGTAAMVERVRKALTAP